MYNGIGLTTPRGSGTNGHVQRNWAFAKPKQKDQTYKTEEDLVKLDAATNRQPNKEILDHERKRKIELKCAEFSEILEEQGFSEEAIKNKVNNYRTMLMGHDGKLDGPINQWGRLSVTETHQLAEAQQEKNARLREAFGISEYFVDGSSFDTDREAKEQVARSEAIQEQERQKALEKEKEKEKEKAHSTRYELVHTPSPEPPALDTKKKKKRKNKEGSSSEEAKKKKKLKKHKRERVKNKEKKKKTKRKPQSNSSSSEESSSSSEESDSEIERKKKKLKKKEKKKKKKESSNDSSGESSPEPQQKKSSEKHTTKLKKKDNTDLDDKHVSRKRVQKDDHYRKQSPSPKRSKGSYSHGRQDHNGEERKSSKNHTYRSNSPSPDRNKTYENYKGRNSSIQSHDKHDYNKRRERQRSQSLESNRKSADLDKKYRERSRSPGHFSRADVQKQCQRIKSPEHVSTKNGRTDSPIRQKHKPVSSHSSSDDHGRSHNKINKERISERKALEFTEKPPNIQKVDSIKERSGTRSLSKSRNHHSKSNSTERDYTEHHSSGGKDKIVQNSRLLEQHADEKNRTTSRHNTYSSSAKKPDNHDTSATRTNHNETHVSVVLKEKEQTKPKERSPKLKSRQQMPVVRLRSSSEDEKSDHENDNSDEEKEKEQRILRLLKSDLAAKAKESLEKKLPKLKQTFESFKKINEEGPNSKVQSSKSGTVPDALEIKVLPLKTDSMSKSKAEESKKLFVSQINSNAHIHNQTNIDGKKVKKSLSRSRTRSRSVSTTKKNKFESSSRSSYRSKSRSRSYSSYSSSSASRSHSRSQSRRRNTSRSRSRSSSRSSSSRTSRSRSPSIPRRHGSPSFLDRRRITSARKRPIPYRRPTPSSPSSVSSYHSSPRYVKHHVSRSCSRSLSSKSASRSPPNTP